MEPSQPTSASRNIIIVVGAAIVLAVAAGGVIQRSRTVTGQGPAFHMSEAGVDYVLHTLNSGACTPAELVLQQPIAQAVPASSGEPLGIFAVTFDEKRDAASPSAGLRLNVIGRAEGAMDTCHAISADVESFSGVLGTKYRVVSWNNQGATRCGSLTQEAGVTCSGRPK